MLRVLVAVAVGLCWPLAGTAQDAAAERRNWFDDPFFQIASGMPGCPEPLGPRITEAERRIQSHHRAEKGTTCWLAGQCERPNFYEYDAAIGAAIRDALRASNPWSSATLWVTVQARVVFFEGCVPDPAMEMALEAYARTVPNVQRAIAAIYVPGAPGVTRPPYRLLSSPP